jgi:hypothetical protein
MSKFTIPVTFTMYGDYEIEAESLDQAIAVVYQGATGLPVEREYVDDSLQIDYESLVQKNEISGSDDLYRCPFCEEWSMAKDWNQATLDKLGGRINYLESDSSDGYSEFVCPMCSEIPYKKELEGPIQTFYVIAIKHDGREEYLRETSGEDCFSDDIGNAILYEKASDCPSIVDSQYIVLVERDKEGWLSVFAEEESK